MYFLAYFLFLVAAYSLMVLADFTAALVELASIRCAQRLAANAGIAIIGYLAAPVGLRQVKTGERIVLAQGVCRPIHGHQDTPQIGMACKGNTEEVVDFALIPVCPWPNSGH